MFNFLSVFIALLGAFLCTEKNVRADPGLGCPDFTPPNNTLIHRTEGQIEVVCERTGESWILVCKNNEWVGRIGNCTKDMGCPDFLPPENTWVDRTRDQLKVICETTGEIWLLECRNKEWFGHIGECAPASAAGCPEFIPPKNSWVHRTGDQVRIVCETTGETWLLVCWGKRWLGHVGDCTPPKHCPDLIPPENTWVHRTGDQVRVVCETTGETWLLVCVNLEWIGHIGECRGAVSCPDFVAPENTCVYQTKDQVKVFCESTGQTSLLVCHDQEWVGKLKDCTGDVSCPELIPPDNTWVHRTKDEVRIVCEATGETWRLVCRNQQWIGHIGSCMSKDDLIT